MTQFNGHIALPEKTIDHLQNIFTVLSPWQIYNIQGSIPTFPHTDMKHSQKINAYIQI